MTGGELKKLIGDSVEAQRRRLIELSLKLHDNPETGFGETRAAGWLADYLDGEGFMVLRGICDLPTAFRGVYGAARPAVAILAEYDALPELGHACGHNIIAASAVGAAVAVRSVIDRLGGSVLVIGTPAEELSGGKIVMAAREAFAGLDAAMMVHPGTRDVATINALACQNLKVEFFGRAAHAAAQPEAGINALEAMLQSFTAINSLRQHIRERDRIHGIVTAGGEAPNIIPAYSAGKFIVRAEDDDYLEALKPRVIACFEGAAAATGARLVYQWEELKYGAMRNNLALARLFMDNMALLGRRFSLSNPAEGFGSTDMGNVSQLVPAIHPMVAIAPPGVAVHSPEFAAAAASEAANWAIVDAARALAMTVADLIADPETLAGIGAEFRHGKGE